MGGRILVVEDTPANMKLICLLLRKAGHEVLEATDAESALALARGQRLDLVLMDIQLPGMDGLAATRLLKADPATRGLPVVALTALAMQGDAPRILAAGCDGYIAKPVQHRSLLQQVEQLLAAGAP